MKRLLGISLLALLASAAMASVPGIEKKAEAAPCAREAAEARVERRVERRRNRRRAAVNAARLPFRFVGRLFGK